MKRTLVALALFAALPTVQAVTIESIAATIRKHFDSDDVIVLVYTPAAETEKQLEGLGRLRKIRDGNRR